MSSGQLVNYQDSIQRKVDSAGLKNFMMMASFYRYFSFPHKFKNQEKPHDPASGDYFKKLTFDQQIFAANNALSEARAVKDMAKTRATRLIEVKKDLRHAYVEYQKKYTLSALCLALFLIGAPLGAIIRKGGLGLPVVVSVIFFLIYYIISTIGEKAVKEGSINPFLGMWIAPIILTPIGLFLSYKAANDSVLFDLDSYKRFFARLIKRKAF